MKRAAGLRAVDTNHEPTESNVTDDEVKVKSLDGEKRIKYSCWTAKVD